MKKVRKTIIRSKLVPQASSASVSLTMKGNRSSNTKPEIALRKALLAAGLRGYRLNWSKTLGRPDIAYPGKKVALFVQGCFWHVCPFCKIPVPKTHTTYWSRKLSNNKIRDRLVVGELKKQGWRVIIARECQIRKSVQKIIARISPFV